MAATCVRTSIPLCLYAGDRNEYTIQVLLDGDPMDTTDATVTAQGRKSRTSEPAAITATMTPVDESKGIYRMAWDGEDVRSMLNGAETWTGVWDLDVLESGETLSITPCDGPLTAQMDVTRA